MVRIFNERHAIDDSCCPHARAVSKSSRPAKPLRNSENLYRTIFETSNSPMCIITDDGIIFSANKRFKTLFGWAREQIAGKHFTYIVAPKYREQITALFEKHKTASKSVSRIIKTRIISQPEQIMDAAFAVNNIPGTGGMVILLLDDIHSKARKKRRPLSDNVGVCRPDEGKLAELLEQEIDLRRQLEATLNERAEFIRIVAHELRTPLTAMLAASDILCENIASEPLQKLAKQVNKGALDLSTRINELFDLAKGEVGMLKLRCQEIFPNRILTGTLSYFSAEATKARIMLIPDWPSDLPPAWGDHRRVTEILNNLIDNAIKYTGENGNITVRACNDSGYILFQVEDTGCGIPPEKQSQLFQAHHRFNASGGKRDGMGLGLALSKMLVELHGGKIWAESNGKGSKFSFTIPLSSQKEGQIL